MDAQHKLVDEKTGAVIEKGAIVTDFRGDTFILDDWTAPRHEGSTGRVYVRPAEDPKAIAREYYPGVIGAAIVPA